MRRRTFLSAAAGDCAGDGAQGWGVEDSGGVDVFGYVEFGNAQLRVFPCTAADGSPCQSFRCGRYRTHLLADVCTARWAVGGCGAGTGKGVSSGVVEGGSTACELGAGCRHYRAGLHRLDLRGSLRARWDGRWISPDGDWVCHAGRGSGGGTLLIGKDAYAGGEGIGDACV
jgi:hypothetical protein